MSCEGVARVPIDHKTDGLDPRKIDIDRSYDRVDSQTLYSNPGRVMFGEAGAQIHNGELSSRALRRMW